METEVISTFFLDVHKTTSNDICEDFLNLINELNYQLEHFKLPSSVDCVYNPTIYARCPFEMYVRKYCSNKKKIMYFGMNPGPWGMSQTGVPFGEINSVKNWLLINGPVGKPPKEIASRPIKGFDNTRTEISGQRFWGLFKKICGSPQKFFETSFVYNYLPQQWMKSNGCNLTPSDFKANEVQQMYNICDPIFTKVLELYEVEIIIAVGKFCETRAKKAIERHGLLKSIQIIYMPHPSPRTVNNNNWEEKALECLKSHNLLQYYQYDSQTTN